MIVQMYVNKQWLSYMIETYMYIITFITTKITTSLTKLKSHNR